MKMKKHSAQQRGSKKQQAKSLRLRKLALAVALSLSASAPNLAQAATYIVTNDMDFGVGSLRRAINDANNVTPGVADTIEFNITTGSNVINLASELTISDSVTIRGPIDGDPSSIILDGGGAPSGNRHIYVNGSSLISAQTITLENITLKNGYLDSSSTEGGGAIYVKNADLVLNHTVISGNSTAGSFAKGGGIYVRYGNANLTQSTVSGNSTAGNNADGGGFLVNSGNATLTQSTISNNSTTGINAYIGGISIFSGDANITQSTVSGNSTSGTNSDGGGIGIRNGDATLSQSTVSGNSVTGNLSDGGGLFVRTADITLIESTVSNNSARGEGGGLFMHQIGSATVIQSTLTNNTASSGSGGISAYMSSSSRNVTLTNSILSGNTGPEGNFEDRATASGGDLTVNFSLFGDSLSEIDVNNGAYSTPSVNPNLGPLQHNGGLTQTHKPNENSPVVDAGNNAYTTGLSFDQRGTGFPRIHNNTVDMGAVELQNNEMVGDPPLSIGEVLTRRDLARELLKAYEHNENYIPLDPNNNNEPYPVTGIYDDVGVGDVNAVFIEDLHRQGFTDGCDTNKFCPDAIVTRAEMAKIFLKASHEDGNYTPPAATNTIFSDVSFPNSFNIDWINELADAGLTVGCGQLLSGDYLFCPQSPVTREWFEFLTDEL